MSIDTLKIKRDHLATEPSIIRKHEDRIARKIAYHHKKQEHDIALGMSHERYLMQRHRRWTVRNEIRANNLAVAFLEGTPYKTLEQKCVEGLRNRHILPRVLKILSQQIPSQIPPVPQTSLISDLMKWIDGV